MQAKISNLLFWICIWIKYATTHIAIFVSWAELRMWQVYRRIARKIEDDVAITSQEFKTTMLNYCLKFWVHIWRRKQPTWHSLPYNLLLSFSLSLSTSLSLSLSESLWFSLFLFSLSISLSFFLVRFSETHLRLRLLITKVWAFAVSFFEQCILNLTKCKDI